MKASNFADAQRAFIIKQGDDGTPVAEICRKAGISQATYFNWKKKYAGLLPTEMKQLEDENTRLKLRVLTVFDTFSRYVSKRGVKFSYRGEDLVARLDPVCGMTGDVIFIFS